MKLKLESEEIFKSVDSNKNSFIHNNQSNLKSTKNSYIHNQLVNNSNQVNFKHDHDN